MPPLMSRPAAQAAANTASPPSLQQQTQQQSSRSCVYTHSPDSSRPPSSGVASQQQESLLQQHLPKHFQRQSHQREQFDEQHELRKQQLKHSEGLHLQRLLLQQRQLQNNHRRHAQKHKQTQKDSKESSRSSVLSRTTTANPSQPLSVNHEFKLRARNVEFRNSLCGQFTVVAEDYLVELRDRGYLPMDRRCTVPVYERIHAAKGAVLLIHGFCSNRATFNVGGGNGKAGASFFEFLAQRGYDTYAIDLRGTRQAQALGAASPGFITEHIEIDVPAAISAIKKIGHEKVYLIGHSMGGAISCAVAGLIPHDVAGVVHMAGLYHLTLPILADVVELYRAVCPKQLQNFLTSGTTYAIRSLYGMLSPTVSAISSAITQERDAAISPPSVSMFHPAAQTSVSTRSAAAFVYYVIAYIRRKHIPVRSVADAFLFAKRFLPDFVSNMVMNMLYPSPWLPYSVEDPALFVDNTLESPTVGVFLSIGTSSLHKDVFNQWLADSSVHRSEIPNSTKSEDDLTGDLKTLRSNSQAKADSAHSRKVEENTEKSGASRVDPPSICIPNSILPNPPCGTAGKLEPGKAKDSYSFHHKWNELGPYLEQFERLQQMPLFFCPANADAILRSEDSLAGYLRSGSKWKEVIEYRDIKVKKTTPSIKSSTNSMGHPVGNISHPTNLTVSEIEQFGDMLGQQDGDKLDLKKLKRVLSGSSVAKSALYNPASSAGVRPGANKVSGECHNTVTGKSGQLEFAVEDDFDMSSLMKPRYAVPSSLRVGHCDILGGKHAEPVWQRIVDWLDVTSAREKEWRFRRRYSAK